MILYIENPMESTVKLFSKQLKQGYKGARSMQKI